MTFVFRTFQEKFTHPYTGRAALPFLSLRPPPPALSRCAVSPTQDCPGPGERLWGGADAAGLLGAGWGPCRRGRRGPWGVIAGREGPPACPASLGAAEPVRSRRGPRKDGKLGRLPGPAGGRVAGRPRRRSGNPPATAAGRFLEAGAPCGRRGRVSGSRGLQEARLGPGSVRSGG